MIALLALVSVVHAASPVCFVPDDQTAGWKQMRIPDEAPGLAAPPDVHQFRSDEPALLIDEDANSFFGASDVGAGKVELTFHLPAGARHLELEFAKPIQGAKVEATGYRGPHPYPLLGETRIRDNSFALDWEISDVHTVKVKIHHHFRPKPVLKHWRIGQWVVVSKLEAMTAFSAPRSLWYFHPGGRQLELCHAPSQTLRVERRKLVGAPSVVTARAR
jgi:hypothetical protein